MSKANYNRIRESLEEALAHIQGKETGVRVSRIEVPAIDVKAIRTKLGLAQPNMATLLGTSLSGYRKWEQGTRRPSGAALMLLRIANAEPKAVLRAFAKDLAPPPAATRARAAPATRRA